jgi:phosphatidylserine/phosphatidylglycerophosphate/cardiolipin synthase-like enzyme
MLDKGGLLSANVEFLLCVRLHAKIFLVDGHTALLGSPNLTGAGIGAKSANKRNLEIGFLFEGISEARPFMNYFDKIWMGSRCAQCKRRDICPSPVG